MSFATQQKTNESEIPSNVQEEILKALKGLRFGSVEIVVHDEKVVQIERKERVRFADRTSGGKN